MAALQQFETGGKKMTLQATIYTTMDSPFGKILIARNSRGLTHINFQEGESRIEAPDSWRPDPGGFDEAIGQLSAYFKGDVYRFDLPLAPEGTPFQLQVWQTLQTIPYGGVISYAELASELGRPHNAARAIGGAAAKNPLPIVIPCHRVIGSNGALTGYAGGIQIKEALLALERSRLERINLQQMFTEFQTDQI
jgi:methylated-DNA-[protein]-cysteine S-methyltransferase